LWFHDVIHFNNNYRYYDFDDFDDWWWLVMIGDDWWWLWLFTLLLHIIIVDLEVDWMLPLFDSPCPKCLVIWGGEEKGWVAAAAAAAAATTQDHLVDGEIMRLEFTNTLTGLCVPSSDNSVLRCTEQMPFHSNEREHIRAVGCDLARERLKIPLFDEPKLWSSSTEQKIACSKQINENKKKKKEKKKEKILLSKK
jgi:hypothetical protein